MSRNILVIESEPGFRETVVRLLALDGYAAKGTGSVDEALACLETESFDLLLCDLRDGQGDVDLLPRLRTGWPASAVVLLANPEEDAEALDSVPALADDVLLKPRCRSDLQRTVVRALEKARLREENRALRKSL